MSNIRNIPSSFTGMPFLNQFHPVAEPSMYVVMILSALLGISTSRPGDRKEGCCESSVEYKYNAMARLSHRFAYELIGGHVSQNGNFDVALSPYSIISVLQVGSPPLNNHVTTMSQPCHNHVTTMSQPCHNHVTTMSQPCHNHVTTMSQSCHNHVTTMSFNCYHAFGLITRRSCS